MIKLWNYLKQKSKTIHELIKESPNKSYRELEIYKDKYEKEHKLRQEAEGETTIVKGIGQNSPEMKAAKLRIEELQHELDRIKRENEELKADQGKEIWTEVWKARYEKEYKLRQEAIELFNDCYAKALELEEELKKFKKKVDPVHKIQKVRESGL